jgi:hypothetical protein
MAVEVDDPRAEIPAAQVYIGSSGNGLQLPQTRHAAIANPYVDYAIEILRWVDYVRIAENSIVSH